MFDVGTTPTFILSLPDTVDMTLANAVYFTLRQRSVTITKSGDAVEVVDGQTIHVFLDQRETLRLVPGAADIQLNWTYADGQRADTNIVTINIGDNLLKAVIS